MLNLLLALEATLFDELAARRRSICLAPVAQAITQPAFLSPRDRGARCLCRSAVWHIPPTSLGFAGQSGLGARLGRGSSYSARRLRYAGPRKRLSTCCSSSNRASAFATPGGASTDREFEVATVAQTTAIRRGQGLLPGTSERS